MKNILFIITLLSIAFLSCDGKDRVHKSNTEVLKKHKLLDSFSKKTSSYTPENYTEIITDTLLNNGFRIKIKAYTDLDNAVLFTKEENTLVYNNYHRNYKFDILVEKDNKIIYNKSFDKATIKAQVNIFKDDVPEDSPYYNFGELAILQYIKVDFESSLKRSIIIDFRYAIPYTNKYSDHSLMINEKGDAHFVNVKVN